MVSIRKKKKQLKKLYAESIIKNTLPYRFGEIKAHLIFYRNSYGCNDYYNPNIKPLRHSIEITYFNYDAYCNEYDSWDITKDLIYKNKTITTNKKIKYNKLRFAYFDC